MSRFLALLGPDAAQPPGRLSGVLRPQAALPTGARPWLPSRCPRRAPALRRRRPRPRLFACSVPHRSPSCARLPPCVLDSSRQSDRCPLGQRRGVKIDVELGQLPSNAGIEGGPVPGLRKRHSRRGESAGKHCGKLAAIDNHDSRLPIEKFLSPSNARSANCTSGGSRTIRNDCHPVSYWLR